MIFNRCVCVVCFSDQCEDLYIKRHVLSINGEGKCSYEGMVHNLCQTSNLIYSQICKDFCRQNEKWGKDLA